MSPQCLASLLTSPSLLHGPTHGHSHPGIALSPFLAIGITHLSRIRKHHHKQSLAVVLVEEYQHALSVANVGGIRDFNAILELLGLRSSPQVYDALKQRLAVADASQQLRMPLLSKDGDVPEDDNQECRGNESRSSFDSTTKPSPRPIFLPLDEIATIE